MEAIDYMVWDVNPIIFEIGFLKVRWYGILFATALALGYSLLKKVFVNEGKPEERMDTLLLYFIGGTIIGARLGHTFFYDWAYYSQNPIEIIKIYRGGLASHGAVVGIILASWLFIQFHFRGHFVWLIDRIAIFVPLGGALIRIGNFFNSEIIGHETDVPWAIVFSYIDNVPRHPAQLYEAIAYLLIFGIMLYLYKKTKASTRPLELTGWFFSLIFGFRIFVEFFKEKQSDAINANDLLSMGQWLSIPIVALGIGFIVYSRLKKASKEVISNA